MTVTANSAIHIGPAGPGDAAAVAAAVTFLLRELRGDPGFALPSAEQAAATAIAGEAGTGVLIARREGETVAVLGYGIHVAVRTAGPYCLIEELWVRPDLRSQGIAALLLAELAQLCARRGLHRIEVCLPKPAFAGFRSTLRFYEANDFRQAGPKLVREFG